LLLYGNQTYAENIMNEQDLRDCFAMFAMLGLMTSNSDWEAEDPYKIADKMVEARKAKPEEAGIVAIKLKRNRKAV
jgi:hypothetical protein